MKKMIVTTAIAALFSLNAEARDVEQGTFMATGDTNLDSGSSKTSYSGGATRTEDNTKLNVAGAYFVARNVGMGLMLNSEYTKINDGTSVTKTAISMLGPIAGYNLSLNEASSLMFLGSIFLADGSVDYGSGTKTDIEGSGYMVGASYNYFLNEHVAMSVTLRHVSANMDLTNSGTTTSADLRENAMNIGFSAFF